MKWFAYVSVRVRTKDGQVAEAVDITQPVGIEVEYEMLQSGYEIRVYYHVVNEEGIVASYPWITILPGEKNLVRSDVM